jgi:hypothetical protein
MQVGPCILVGIQLEKAEVSHLLRPLARERVHQRQAAPREEKLHRPKLAADDGHLE